MKSVGEAMALGRSFPEAIQKALRIRGEPGWGGYPGARLEAQITCETDASSASGKVHGKQRVAPRVRVLAACSGGPLAHWSDAQLAQELARPSDHRMLALCECAWRAAVADAEGIARAAAGWSESEAGDSGVDGEEKIWWSRKIKADDSATVSGYADTTSGRSSATAGMPTEKDNSILSASLTESKWSVSRVWTLTGIDRWFLMKLWRLSRVEVATRMGCIGGGCGVHEASEAAADSADHQAQGFYPHKTAHNGSVEVITHAATEITVDAKAAEPRQTWDAHVWRAYKQYGYSDQQLCNMIGAPNAWTVRNLR